ncbi:hypothetical protein [Microcoleus sp. herbarium12]|uniref:hypothetical protein n=1 Tax=Microcoleus sp. herbarium12 TaxID=3055437 RepID=UPI002FD670EF
MNFTYLDELSWRNHSGTVGVPHTVIRKLADRLHLNRSHPNQSSESAIGLNL